MLPVLLRFLLPVGGGIPAGVLLARSKGLPWFLTAGLYLVSDVLLALAFEPILRLLVHWGRRVPFLALLGEAMQGAMARSAALVGGGRPGPCSLILVAFGVDPMTGRAAALAAGHGFLLGWAFAITGDMLYYGVVAAATLGLHTWIRDPGTTVMVVLLGMILLPMAVQRVRGRRPAPQTG